MTLAGKRVVITGGNGFIGSNLAQRLVRESAAVTRLTRAEGDLGESRPWRQSLPGVDVVFHLAAQTSVYLAERDPAADWRANVQPMLSLLEACRALGCRPLILFAGTVTQCGLPERTPVDEAAPDRPATAYDRHKLEAEAALEQHVRDGVARGATLRLANVYGPGPASGSGDRGVLNQVMRRALRGEALTLYGTGSRVRDYVHVADAAEAFVAAALHGDAVDGRHFIVASGEGHTLAQAFELVAERAALLTGAKVPIERVAPPPRLSVIEDRDFVGDASRLRAATGWRPRIRLAEGIDMTLRTFGREGIRA